MIEDRTPPSSGQTPPSSGQALDPDIGGRLDLGYMDFDW